MERVVIRRAYPLWKICAALLALLALLAMSQSFFRLPGSHVAARAAAATAGGDPIYMSYEGITGDVTAQGYTGQIELNSFQWGVGRAISSPTGGGGDREAAAPSVSEITVTKPLDKASPALLSQSLAGEGKLVVISFVKSDNGQLKTYLKVTLTNTLISSFSMSSGGDRPTESLTFNFTKIQFDYTAFDANGQGAVTTVGYDLALKQVF